MNATIDDVDSHIVYSTNPAWNTNVWAEQSPQPLYGTNHGTPNPGAIATFTFTGTAVYVYGYKASDHGYRLVSVDGSNPVRCDGRTGDQGSRALVYWADGLPLGTHDITFQHAGTQGQYLNLDYFLVTNSDWGVTITDTNLPTGTAAGYNPTPTNTGGNNTSPSSSPPIGIIVGVVVAAAVVSLIVLAWFLWSRRRKAKQKLDKSAYAAPEGGVQISHSAPGGGVPWTSKTGPPNTGAPSHMQPFYSPVPTQPPSNAFSAQQRQPYPESSSGYHSGTAPTQSLYSSAPSTSSPPPTEARFVSTAHTIPESRSTPWTSSVSTESATGTTRTQATDPSMMKARYSGANTLGNTSQTSSSRPLSSPVSPAADYTNPPPQYEQ